MNAELALRFERGSGATRLRVGVQQPPWKVVRAFRQPNGAALVHLHNVSGGVLAGDCLTLSIDVEAGAQAHVTTTGATRLYRHRPNSPESRQNTTLSVAEGGLLEYLPDPLIPFANSRHVQSTNVHLAHGATFFWWEVLAPGRQAMGEAFAFESLRVDTRVSSPARPLVLESYCLEPRLRPMESVARMGGYSYLASFYAIQVGRPAAALRALESKLSEIAGESSRPGAMIWGAGTLASDGVIVRGLSTTAREIPATLARFWTVARRFLTAEDAVPARKLR